MISSLIVNIMIAITEQLLDLPADSESEVVWLQDQAAQQMRLVFLGSMQWKPKSVRDKQKAIAQG